MNAISFGVFPELDLSYLFQISWLAQAPVQPVPVQSAPVQPVGNAASGLFQGTGFQLGQFIPSFLGALVILIVGWVVATIVASLIQSLLKKTGIDRQISGMAGQRSSEPSLPIAKWVATSVYWLILAFTLVAFLNALRLESVSTPLNAFLQQILGYLPRLGSAAVLLGIAWLIATLAKTLVTNGLARFNLDDKLREQTGEVGGESPIVVTETLGNALYWFVFLFFLPLVLDVLELQGPLAPVQNLLDQILSALPKILTAILIGAIGWLVARIVKGITTNLLAAIGTDQLGARMGFNRSAGGMSLSTLLGTVVYVLVLIPTAIAALNALDIAAISTPAVAMLNQVLTKLPQILTAGLIVTLFYFIGRFVADLVANILTSIGFNNITSLLGIPALARPVPPIDEVGMGSNALRTEALLPSRTPSEVAGIVTLVGIILFGVVTATEVLGLPALTALMNGVLAVSLRVLVGIAIFAIGLYLANLAFKLITLSGGRQANVLGQTARVCILALVAAMSLQQMGIASSIVNLAFGLLLGAVSVAIALAFGLGGRDIAAEKIRGFLNSFEDGKS
ncbi:MAG: mechanosensitive ion channel [Leptolyngbyaceae cyanobacterium CSU_1_4]|nr:mechanosensitive ion channel [Leptolyngbyaceae cyanobacterium CSU_1_4]